MIAYAKIENRFLLGDKMEGKQWHRLKQTQKGRLFKSELAVL